jgi:superfamily II DNA or RNA helicase
MTTTTMAEETDVATYMGQKGYSIYKENMCVKDQHSLREELIVRPYVPKAPVQPEGFAIYRESPKKIYIPRFFGLKEYGEPDEYRIPRGDAISLTFNGNLRDYQVNIVEIYKKALGENGGGGLLEIPCGRGKTVIALNIISQLKVKTLVIVHKGFLLNQWVERIEQFLPGARVGKIQGQVIDIDNKDIVVGMLQSLSMKDYPSDMFSSFGLTIVDECHHISSEIFSRSLQRIVTRCMLGLSATMQRKDGLTRVFKMFLGEIIYKEKREAKDDVLVKTIQYITTDEDFNQTVYDYRGKPAYSKMISKLCDYNHRSEFILQVLIREMEEKSEQQIMILAQNKSLLVYLHNAIEHRNIATVGYYIGGMKEVELKKSETKQVIIATYAMAAEALDIKTLTTLFLVTPRTDVTQAVGRILRVKHERPLVVDIVDSHDVFKRQYQKRKKFYIQNKYKIMKTNSNTYVDNKWHVEYDPTIKNKGKSSENTDDTFEFKPDIPKGKCVISL